jgi:hypothetical protein
MPKTIPKEADKLLPLMDGWSKVTLNLYLFDGQQHHATGFFNCCCLFVQS